MTETDIRIICSVRKIKVGSDDVHRRSRVSRSGAAALTGCI